MKSSSYNLLAKITQQMDTISTKVGEEPALDKMVNLLSILKYQDRKFTADEMLMEVSLMVSTWEIISWQYFEDLDPEELKYMEDMLAVVKELLLIEFSITSAMLPSQRIAWMSIPGNWENHRRYLAILGQLLQWVKEKSTFEGLRDSSPNRLFSQAPSSSAGAGINSRLGSCYECFRHHCYLQRTGHHHERYRENGVWVPERWDWSPLLVPCLHARSRRGPEGQ